MEKEEHKEVDPQAQAMRESQSRDLRRKRVSAPLNSFFFFFFSLFLLSERGNKLLVLEKKSKSCVANGTFS